MVRASLLALMLAVGIVTGGVLPASITARAAAQEATPSDCPPATEEENRAVVQQYYDIVNGHDFQRLTEVLAPVVIQHAADVPDARGVEETIANLEIFLEAFPDLHSDIELWATDGDLVAARVIQSGTQEGDFLGIPASGKHATWTVLGIFRIECGHIAEHWVEVDQISRLEQLGAIPETGAESQATSTRASEATPAGEAAAAISASPMADCAATTEEENAELIRRWYDEIWNQGDFSNFDDYIAPDHDHHRVLNLQGSGSEARQRTVRQWREAFPDRVTTVDFLMTDGDLVVARWMTSGTHLGQWRDVPATGKTVSWTGNTIFRIECGRIAEEWSEAASLSFFQQLGVMEGPVAPLPEASPSAG